MYLHALGHFHPENVVSNEFLSSLGLDTNEQWILERVGIHTRHTVLPLDYLRETKNADPRQALKAATLSNAQTGARAAQVAFDRSGVTARDIGLVVAGGCTPDENIPAEACRISEVLGIEAPSLDLASACSSFCAQLYFLEAMRPEKLPDWILVVNPENSTRVVSYADRTACVLWGDASSAAVLSPRIPGPWKVTQTYLKSDPSGADKVKVPMAGHFTQQGAAVQRFAVERASETYLHLLETWTKSGEGRGRQNLTFIGHQANLRMLEAVAKRCEVPPGMHRYNVDRRGNTGAAGAPSVMSELWDEPGALGDAVALCVVGSGLTWAGALLERQP